MRLALNLLAPEKRSDLHAAFSLAFAQRLLAGLFLIAVFSALTILGLRMMLRSSLDVLAQSVTGESEEATAFADTTKSINAYLARVDERLKGSVAWSSVVRELTSYAPDGAQYTEIRIEKPDVVRLFGVARTRADILALKGKLEASPNFKEVKAPLSNILQQRDVKFEFEMRRVAP